MRLEPLQFWFRPAQGPLLRQLRPALAAAARQQAGPGAHLLRWAITAAEPGRGLQIEAVLLAGELVSQPSEPGQGSGQKPPAPQRLGPQIDHRPQIGRG